MVPMGLRRKNDVVEQEGIMMKEMLEILKTNTRASNLTILLVLPSAIISWRKDQFLSGSSVTIWIQPQHEL